MQLPDLKEMHIGTVNGVQSFKNGTKVISVDWKNEKVVTNGENGSSETVEITKEMTLGELLNLIYYPS